MFVSCCFSCMCHNNSIYKAYTSQLYTVSSSAWKIFRETLLLLSEEVNIFLNWSYPTCSAYSTLTTSAHYDVCILHTALLKVMIILTSSATRECSGSFLPHCNMSFFCFHVLYMLPLYQSKCSCNYSDRITGWIIFFSQLLSSHTHLLYSWWSIFCFLLQ